MNADKKLIVVAMLIRVYLRGSAAKVFFRHVSAII